MSNGELTLVTVQKEYFILNGNWKKYFEKKTIKSWSCHVDVFCRKKMNGGKENYLAPNYRRYLKYATYPLPCWENYTSQLFLTVAIEIILDSSSEEIYSLSLGASLFVKNDLQLNFAYFGCVLRQNNINMLLRLLFNILLAVHICQERQNL